jgi:probable phosphoglycerate mutase
MRVNVWCDGSAMPNGGSAGAGYVVVGEVLLLGSDPLGDATNNTAEYTAVLNALRVAADMGATQAHVRVDSKVVYHQLRREWKCNLAHLIALRTAVEEQVARYPGGVTFKRMPREENGVADALSKLGAVASKKLNP